MSFTEDDLLPLSGLQHLLFCERQCALIHVEQLWADNRLTVEGGHMHRKVDSGNDESRGDVRIRRGMSLRSLRLGLIGRADVVEFHRVDGSGPVPWRPVPVEYKRGRPKREPSDQVQLCAQALCLEEMLDMPIPAGALYYGQTRHRQDVLFDERLRAETEHAAARLHVLVRSGTTPPARREPKCENCSLLHLCLPETRRGTRSVRRYLARSIDELDSAARGDAMPVQEPP